MSLEMTSIKHVRSSVHVGAVRGDLGTDLFFFQKMPILTNLESGKERMGPRPSSEK